MLLISLLILGSATLEMVSPILSKYVVDEIVNNLTNQAQNSNVIISLIIAMFVVNIVAVINSSISNRLGDHLSGELRKHLTEKFYHKIMTLPQSFFDNHLSGKISNQLNRGIIAIEGFANSVTNFILPTFLQTFLSIIVLGYYNLSVALFTIILFPIYLYLSYLSAKRWGKKQEKRNKYEDITRGRIHEVISNIKVVKSFNREFFEQSFISKNLKHINNIYASQSKEYHIFDFARNFSLQLILFIISIIVFYNAFIGKLSVGEMVLIIQLVSQVRRPLFAMSFIFSRLQEAESNSKEFLEIIDLESTEEILPKNEIKIIENPKITFDNVSFEYEKDKKVLDNISFEINSNEKVALVGPSGAGKSTIINLILKFYQPIAGEISINNLKYSELMHAAVRNNISLVFQDNELFSSTIKENVAYGKPDASQEDIVNALQKANAYEFVKKFEKGINTEVGERGIKLSGGQKQRIQIARAILDDAPILILDEATSSLDSESEFQVQEAISKLMANKMVIVIAHRLSTIQSVDRIIVIDDGKIAEIGSPQKLAQSNGIYAKLLKYQIDGNKKILKNFDIYK
jgi:ATP-binding cassette, subfamily B, bacterial